MNETERLYEISEWTIEETAYRPATGERGGTTFFLGNGLLGIRGSFEEESAPEARSHKGTYINGFYDSLPITYGEEAYGYARNRQIMVNLADPTEIRITLNGNPFSLDRGSIITYSRVLDMRKGVLTRSVLWRAPEGDRYRLDFCRMVSFSRPHLILLEIDVTPLDGETDIQFISLINDRAASYHAEGDPRIGTKEATGLTETAESRVSGNALYLEQKTIRSGLTAACMAEHEIHGGSETMEIPASRNEYPALSYQTRTGKGGKVSFTKRISYRSSTASSSGEEKAFLKGVLNKARLSGNKGLKEEQRRYLDAFWEDADIHIGGDQALQQGIRFNLYALLQSAGRDGKRNIAAKGLSGEGYEGHYFWDTEIYVLPFFTYTRPEIARSLLNYRHRILPQARQRAGELAEAGAIYPWRTISGEEASAYFPAGTAQYHINADIVYGLRKYCRAAPDPAFEREQGLEMAVETARLWMSLGAFIPGKGNRFCLNGVTGPDEYTALVNNNTYTNMMARENLTYAAELVEKAAESDKGILKRLQTGAEEAAEWRHAARDMYIPYDRERGIHPQDDAFLDKEPWDFAATPPEKYPLLLHYHPLVLYRHQVLKQPDTVLAAVLLGQHFSYADKRRNFLYYDPLTTGDSSLAPCIQSVAAAELNLTEEAYSYFMRTARMDLDDVNGNVCHGVHTASMAGSWISLVYGFAGMRETEEGLAFNPALPRQWDSLDIPLLYHGTPFRITIDHSRAVYRLRRGAETHSLSLRHRGEPFTLTGKEPEREFSLRPRPEAVLFDLDGVITDTAEHHYRAWKKLAEEEGWRFDRGVNEKLRGIGRRDSLKIILDYNGKALGEEELSAAAERKNRYYRELLETVTPEDILPGIHDLLTALRRDGIPTALTSASRNAPRVLCRLGLDDAFDTVVDPAGVIRGKPDPEIFLAGAEQLGVPYGNCIGVEDAAAGVEAIKAAGMFAVGIGPAAREAHLPLEGTASLSWKRLTEAFEARGRRPSDD